jgi:hypothetical protein
MDGKYYGATSVKNKIIIIALFVGFVLGACAEAQHSQVLPIVSSTHKSTSSITPLPTSTQYLLTFKTATALSFFTAPPVLTSTPSSTVTTTPTLDYAALGIPSPTPTATFEYDRLSSFYLTPFTPLPTLTGHPQLSPTPGMQDLFSRTVVRNLPPQTQPVFSLPAYIQRVTDLMNYFGDDKEAYLNYINTLSPTAFQFSSDWFWTGDFDNDKQPEWLISLPTRQNENGTIGCGNPAVSVNYCPRQFLLFEKEGNSYIPVAIHPIWFDGFGEKIVRIEDLNKNHSLEIVFQTDVCGTACSTYISIAEWNGSKWSDEFGLSSELAEVTFADLEGNGTIEISLKYSTGAASKYNSPYPFREGLVDVYSWKNGRYELVDQIYPPTESVFAAIFDLDHALEYKNAELVFKHINPVIETLDQSCDRMKTYVGIQAMLAYALKGDSNGMKSTLVKLEKYCDFPGNAYLPAARILWLAYEKSHDPIRACQAMERFLRKEYTRENGRLEETFFVDWRPTSIPSCPQK